MTGKTRDATIGKTIRQIAGLFIVINQLVRFQVILPKRVARTQATILLIQDETPDRAAGEATTEPQEGIGKTLYPATGVMDSICGWRDANY